MEGRLESQTQRAGEDPPTSLYSHKSSESVLSDTQRDLALLLKTSQRQFASAQQVENVSTQEGSISNELQQQQQEVGSHLKLLLHQENHI